MTISIPLLFSFVTFTLVACDSGITTSEVTLTVELGDAISLKERKTTVLTPAIQSSDNDLSYLWQQLSGPAMQFENVYARELKLTSPSLDEDESAVVKLTVHDRTGYSVSDTKLILLTANRPTTVKPIKTHRIEQSPAQPDARTIDPGSTIADILWQQLAAPDMPGTAGRATVRAAWLTSRL